MPSHWLTPIEVEPFQEYPVVVGTLVEQVKVLEQALQRANSRFAAITELQHNGTAVPSKGEIRNE